MILKGLAGRNGGEEEADGGQHSGREKVRARGYANSSSAGGRGAKGGWVKTKKKGRESRDSRHASEQTGEMVGSRAQT